METLSTHKWLVHYLQYGGNYLNDNCHATGETSVGNSLPMSNAWVFFSNCKCGKAPWADNWDVQKFGCGRSLNIFFKVCLILERFYIKIIIERREIGCFSF